MNLFPLFCGRIASFHRLFIAKIGFFALVLMVASCSDQPSKTGEDYFELIRTTKIQSDPTIKWQNFGPAMSGYNEEFWTHPSDASVMMMGPDMHVSYGSWDGGDSWQTLKDHDGTGLEMKRVLDIEFSRQDPDFAMAIDWNGWAYESNDRGRSWRKTNELSRHYSEIGIDPNDPDSFAKGWYYEQQGTRLAELAVDPTDDNIWYVGAGDFWNVKANHKSKAKPYGNRLGYADYGYVLKTEDKGQSWLKLETDLPETLDVAKIIVDPQNNLHVVMASNHGVFISENGGLNWHQNVNGLPHNLPRDMVPFVSPRTGALTLYLVEQTVFTETAESVNAIGGVYKSTDGGYNWSSITGNLAFDLSRISSPPEHERYYRAISHWFGIKKDQAKRRFPTLPSSVLPVFNRIAINPSDENEIYLSYNKKHDRTFGPGDLWRTLDGGETWKVVVRQGQYWIKNPDEAYWSERKNAVGTNVEFAHLQPYMDRHTAHQGNRMLAINSLGEVFIGIDQQTLKSSDKGATWRQVDDVETSPGSKQWIGRGGSNLPGRFMLHETGIKHRRLLASGEHGLWQTVIPEGWENQSDVVVEQLEGQRFKHGLHSVSTIAVHPNDPNIIYLLAWRQYHRGHLRRSTDGGQSWENISQIFEAEPWDYKVATQNSLMVDPVTPKYMYFCATALRVSEIHNGPSNPLKKGEYGFYRSRDGGFNWEPANAGFHEGASIRRIAMHPDNTKRFYAAANDDNGGLYVSENRGDLWRRVVIPEEIKAVNNVFIDRNTRDILISTGRNNGTLDEGGVWRSADNGETWERIFKAPFVWQAETSPVNPDIVVVSAARQIVSMADDFKNPGIYLSKDRGTTWQKINYGLGQPDKMVDVKPDPYNENVLWSSAWGSGWNVAYLNGERTWYEGAWYEGKLDE